MINAIVTSMEPGNILATPSGNIDPGTLIGRKARYVDKSDKVWPAKIVGAEDPFVRVEFEVFPSGLGQGQILEIYESEEEENSGV